MKYMHHAIVLMAIVSGCSAEHRSPATPEMHNYSVSVAEVRNNAEAWDRKTVVIDGYLGPCEGYDCFIFAKPLAPDADIVTELDNGLSIGSRGDFDQNAHDLQYKRVLLTAKINAAEIHMPGLDRAEQLRPVDIIEWKASKLTKESK